MLRCLGVNELMIGMSDGCICGRWALVGGLPRIPPLFAWALFIYSLPMETLFHDGFVIATVVNVD